MPATEPRSTPTLPRAEARPRELVSAIDSPLPDDELVLRARDGDRWAQEAIFRRYGGPIVQLARRLLACREDADDVVQDTFSAALKNLDGLAEPERLRDWLFGIAVHRVRRRHRKLKLLRALGLDRGVPDATLAELAASSASPEVLVELRRIDAIIADLPTNERLAWMLRYVEGESLEDVARLTGCSLATAKRRITAVQVRVQSVLAREGLR